MSSLLIVASGKVSCGRDADTAAPDAVGVQTCYRRVCVYTTGYLGSSNQALTISLRCCGTTPYTSSNASRFTNMLLSPPPFRLQVSWFTSESFTLNSSRLSRQFPWCVTRRTLSQHPPPSGELKNEETNPHFQAAIMATCP